MRSTGIFALALAAGLAIGCGGNARDRADESANSSETAGTAGQASDTVSHGSDSDARHFAVQASKHGAAEVELGKLAQQKAQRADVREFAAMMVRDHTAGIQKLEQAVTPHRGEVNTELPDASEELMARLQKLSGAAFDREYMKAMVDGHQEMRGMVTGRLNDAKRMTTSKSGLEQAVDDWAQQALPTVEQHLAKAEQINESLQGKSTEPY